MVFDKNQTEFPSEEHRQIWNLGIHILPLERTLPQEVRAGLPSHLTESCEQMQQFLLYYLGDIYENLEVHLPLPGDWGVSIKLLRPLIDLALLGEANEDQLSINRFAFDAFIKKLGNSKQFREDKKSGGMERRLALLERSGLKIKHSGVRAVLMNALYPNMFYALYEMAKITITLKEKGSAGNSFMYCDFRTLCKSYKYDKFENALVFLSDEQRQVALALDQVAKKLGLTRSIPNGFADAYSIIYKHRKYPIMNIFCAGNKISLGFRIPYDRDNLAPLEAFFEALERDAPEAKKYFMRRSTRCRGCKGDRSGECTVAVRDCGSVVKLCEPWWHALMWGSSITRDEIQHIDKILDNILVCI